MFFRIYETNTPRSVQTDSRTAVIGALTAGVVRWDIRAKLFYTVVGVEDVRAFFDATHTSYVVFPVDPNE